MCSSVSRDAVYAARGAQKNGKHGTKQVNPLPVQFKALLHGQKGCVFFGGHLNLRTAPETGLPSREKNHNN